MLKHEFSPILDETKFRSTLEYLATQTIALAKVVLGRTLSIDTLAIFAQSTTEHSFLDKLVRRYGPVSKFSHEPTLYIDSDFDVTGYHIKLLGLREPDSTRPQVGYGDYPVDDYAAIRTLASPYTQEIVSGRGKVLLELRHPDFDVLGYVVPAEDHA